MNSQESSFLSVKDETRERRNRIVNSIVYFNKQFRKRYKYTTQPLTIWCNTLAYISEISISILLNIHILKCLVL